MRIKSMVLEGFKSYGKRIEINGFDKEFNAITGFNGTGKSNILDAICFVLGITNLGQVRATSLQDLVYKSGQAGIKKASVTITFDNCDRDSSPHGYDNYEEITITRQIIIGKNMMNKNNYMINGSNVPNKKVHDMFCSVQLNVNNPHFLIMQGRITKVLNMKPIEILSMIEEAAGTSMYEHKKQTSLRLIEKKDNKLKEITNILREEIGPKLTKLKEERSQYVEFQKVERELEHSRKIQLAWNYVTALNNSELAEKNVQNLQHNIDGKTNSIAAGEKEIQDIDRKCDEINEEKSAEESAKLKSLENNLQEVENGQFKLKAEINGNKETIKAAQTAVTQLKANISEDDSVLLTKQNAYTKFGTYFQKLKEADEQDSKAVLAAQEVYQKISSGLLQSEDGENATLEQQLINAKQIIVQAQTECQQCEMKLKHSKAQITKMQTDMHSTKNEYKKNYEDLQNKEKELKNLENELNKLDYREGYIEELQQEKFTLLNKIKVLTETVDQFESRYPQTRFEYFSPNNFKKGSVKGLVCKLINIKDKSAAYALEIAAGAKLYNVIVDTETTGKRLLQEGKLRQRVTIIPLNKVEGRSLDEQTVNCAQNLVGADKVVPALSLIDFPAELNAAVTWIFGDIFICKDMEAATEVAYHRNIMKKCVTLQGDVFDPFGALSGGATPKSGSVLLQLQDIKGTQNELRQMEHSLQNIESTIRKTSMIAEKFLSLKQTYDLRSYEINLVKQRLQQTTHHKIKEEIESLHTNISELTQKITEAKKLERDNIKRATELESQLKDATTIHERQLKDAENKLKMLRGKAEASRKEWQSREQESETLELEINELKKGIETGKDQLLKAEEKLIALTEKEKLLQQDLHETEIKVSSLQSSVKEQREKINQQNEHIQKLLMRKDDIIKQNGETQLDIKKLNLEMKTIKSFATSCKQKILDLTRKYEWIEQEKIYFGKTGGIYDFTAMKIEELSEKVQHLETVCKQLSRNVNTRAINLLDKEEERYTEVLKKKKIVENDKRKIIETIQHLDQKKKETLLKAWEQVNKDFSSIFSSLLPGADAKLQPVENQEVTDGLEVKIGFSGVWKESLGELSGGQRSLVALSLILAMLLFKPAPLYILDEVDAALDLSHTENIGTMLKRHFKHSQFIVVSLKDGMFNNANVLFTTKFVDGMSTISRLEKVRNK